MTRPTRAKIDLNAFKANYDLAARLAGDAVCMAVIKANGYGHGICEVAKALPDAPLAVACVDEALVLRNSGIDNPILVLEGAFTANEVLLADTNNIQLVVHSCQQIEQLKENNSSIDNVEVWLKLNTGMNRLGFRPNLAVPMMSELQGLSAVRVLGAMTHFSCADEIDKTHTEEQLAVFSSSVEVIRLSRNKFQLSAANSAALIEHPSTRFDQVRPGIILYGSSPFSHLSADELNLQAVMHLESRIMAVHDLSAGDCVGYGRTWCASKDSRIGVVAIGYADGYPRHAPTGTPVWIEDRIVPLVGRVSMDMLMVDLSFHPDAQVGTLVELWGSHLSVDEVAKAADTIGYELLTGITSRVPRVYS